MMEMLSGRGGDEERVGRPRALWQETADSLEGLPRFLGGESHSLSKCGHVVLIDD